MNMQSSRKKKLIKKRRGKTLTWDLLCRDSLTFLLLLIDGQNRHFNGVTNDIRNHKRLENLKKKKRKKYFVFIIFYFWIAGKAEKENEKI